MVMFGKCLESRESGSGSRMRPVPTGEVLSPHGWGITVTGAGSPVHSSESEPGAGLPAQEHTHWQLRPHRRRGSRASAVSSPRARGRGPGPSSPQPRVRTPQPQYTQRSGSRSLTTTHENHASPLSQDITAKQWDAVLGIVFNQGSGCI